MCYFFFFKQKTAYEMRISYWSSDVCSSDLVSRILGRLARRSHTWRFASAKTPRNQATTSAGITGQGFNRVPLICRGNCTTQSDQAVSTAAAEATCHREARKCGPLILPPMLLE